MSATLITFIIIACVIAVVVINRIFIKEEFISKPSEYDRHSVGSYLKMRKELKGILSTAGNFHGYNLNFNLGEIGTGLAVLVLFAVVVTLGVVLC